MKVIRQSFVLFFIVFFLSGAVFPPQEDIEGSKDHPLLTRMKNFYISDYKEMEFDSAEFYDVNDKEYIIEGRKWVINYSLKEGFNPPGQLKIFQNHINAIKQIGGEVLDEKGKYLRVVKEGKEVWINVWVSGGAADYRLTIVEKTVMEQDVVADPKALADSMKSRGHAAVYGIYFDTDSDVIKPESEPSLKAVAEMLKTESALKVYVVGHSDMTGNFAHNMDLSARRAQAVVNVLVEKYGISSGRLASKGVGPLCPVSTNKTEEGRKLNRRVELVEM